MSHTLSAAEIADGLAAVRELGSPAYELIRDVPWNAPSIDEVCCTIAVELGVSPMLEGSFKHQLESAPTSYYWPIDRHPELRLRVSIDRDGLVSFFIGTLEHFPAAIA